jgi:hypothetical protein
MASKDAASLIAKEFVALKIDENRGIGAKDLKERLIGKTAQGSLPAFSFLDADGKCLITSVSPDTGNIGHPGTSEEMAYFKKMFQTVKRKLTDDEINSLIQSLEAFNKSHGIGSPDAH